MTLWEPRDGRSSRNALVQRLELQLLIFAGDADNGPRLDLVHRRCRAQPACVAMQQIFEASVDALLLNGNSRGRADWRS